jgi:hypothetical protein
MYVDDTPLAMDNNVVPMRNVYPASGGGTLATAASASSPDQFMTGPVSNSDGTAAAVTTPAPADRSVGGHPLTWWLGIAIIVAGIMFFARKSGQASEFSNIRPSIYNGAVITFVAILGITVMKILAVKVRAVPGLGGFSSVVIAA